MRHDVEVELLVAEVHVARDIDQRLLGVEREQPRLHHAVGRDQIRRHAVDLDHLVAEHLVHRVAADIQAGQLEQRTADGAVVDQQLHLAVRTAEQGRRRITRRRERRIAIHFAEARLHGRERREQLLQLEVACTQIETTLHRGLRTIEADVAAHRAAGHAELQRVEGQDGVFHDQVGRHVLDGQALAVDDLHPGELHIGIHRVPAVGLERLDRQHLVRGLFHRIAALCFLLV